MTIYFVITGNKEELEVVRELKPKNILLSYWYFRNKPLSEFCSQLGYKPNILLDSGAYSAFTKNKTVNFLDYMKYIDDNSEWIGQYISLDVIGDSNLTYLLYNVMKQKGYTPIPVYHYGEHPSALYRYINLGEKRIALGGTVPIKNKIKIVEWCEELRKQYPLVDFHLLGSTNKVVLESQCVTSCDSSTWYMMAVNGHPKEISGKTRTSKIERAKYQMKKLMRWES